MAHYGYFDESGNFGFAFDRPNVSTHFIVGAIIFSVEKLSQIEQLAESIAQTFFNGSEIKSSNVGSNDQRRLDILKSALQAEFFVYAMVFDKRQIYSQGLHNKRSFLKFLNKLAYENILSSFNQIKLVADEHGGREFMDSFRIYLEKKFARKDLFGQMEFGFEQSKSNRLLQLSDFFVGSIARCYDENTLSPKRNDIMALLLKSSRLLPIFEWPSRMKPYPIVESETREGKFDETIMTLSIKKAEKFVLDNKGRHGHFIPEQVATVKVLLQHIRYGSRYRYLGTNLILRYFSVNSSLDISKKQFGRSVIGPLRDSGVLVTSNTRGYKLIGNVADLKQFVDYFHHFLHPMLERLALYRRIIKLATKNELDILKGKQYDYLRNYYRSIGKE